MKKLFALLCLIIAGGFLWSLKKERFPYGESSAGIQIQLKDHAFGPAHGKAYKITAGDIEGEAVLTRAPMKSAAQALVNSELVGVRSTFQNSRAPYGGHITSFIDCDSQKFVHEENLSFAGAQTELILAVATARRIFGSCSADQIKYASAIWAGYDAVKKQVLTVKLFKPVSGPDRVEESQQEILRVLQQMISHSGGQ